MKPYNYRNPSIEAIQQEAERRERRNDMINMLALGLAIANLVLWCTVLK